MTPISARSFGPIIRKVMATLFFAAITVTLFMLLMGFFSQKVAPKSETAYRRPVAGAKLATVETLRIPRTESAVGTIQAVRETSVASKLLAKVLAVHVVAGQQVTEGDVLVELDQADLRARLNQAEAQADSARAAQQQAQIEFDRVKALIDKAAASEIELSRVKSTLDSASADLQRAEHAIREASTILEYATLRAPMSGTVIDKRIEVGDTASPGQVLVTLYDPTRMQLVAGVRESLTRRLQVGQSIGIQIDAIDRNCEGRISEIVPEAASQSRTFSVKVTGPCPPGVYAGMFGRLLILLDEEEVLVIPIQALREVGQLQLVDVAEGENLHRRTVQVGRSFDGNIEVLSGLREGEKVALSDERAETAGQ